MEEIHRIPATAFSTLRRRSFRRLLTLVSVSLGGGALLAIARWGGAVSSAGLIEVGVAWLLLGLFAWRRSVRMVRWASEYRAALSDDRLVVTSALSGPREVLRGDVTRIVESPGALSIYGSRMSAGIPREIERYDELRARIAQWAPIRRTSYLGRRAAVYALFAAWVIALYAQSTPVPIVAAVSAGVVGTMGWSAWKVLRSPFKARYKAQLVLMTLVLAVMSLLRLLSGIGS